MKLEVGNILISNSFYETYKLNFEDSILLSYFKKEGIIFI